MEVEVHCQACGERFAVAKSMTGGLANCPGCGKVTPVRGLRDPLWRLWQVVWLLVVGGAAVVAYRVGGVVAAGVVVAVGLVGGWVVSRGL